MTQQVVGIGTSANDGTGDTPRTAFSKVNSNFAELYGGFFATIASQALARTALGYGSLATLATSGTPSSSNFLRGDGLWTNPAYANLSGLPTLGTLAALNQASLTTNVTGILPIANGGTGTASPGIVAGTGVTVTGSWPTQTINATGGGGGTPGGSSGQLQWNSSATFAGVAGSTVSANGGLTLGGASLTANDPVLNMTQTWNNAAVTFTAMSLNITRTTSQTQGCKAFEVNVNGSSYFAVLPDFTGAGSTVSMGGNQFLSFGASNGIWSWGALSTANWLGMGTAGPVVPSGGSYGFSANASYGSISVDTRLTRRAAAQLQLGAADAAAPVAQMLTAQGVSSGTQNTVAPALTIASPRGTGVAAGSSIKFQVDQTDPVTRQITSMTGTASPYTINFAGGQVIPVGTVISVNFVTPGTLTGQYTVTSSSAGQVVATTSQTGTWSANGYVFTDSLQHSTTVDAMTVTTNSNGAAIVNIGTLANTFAQSSVALDIMTSSLQVVTGGSVRVGSVLQFSTSAFDIGMSRNAAGVVEVNSTVVGTYRDLKLRNLIFSDGTQISTSPARTLLTTITPTAVASIAYTSIPSGYSKFEIEFDNVTNANGGANEAPLIALSANNGTTYDSSQCGAANTGLSGAMYGRISIAPVGVTANKIAEGAATQGTVYWAIGGKWTSQTGVTNAIRFAWSGGSNFVAQGAIRIYGIV